MRIGLFLVVIATISAPAALSQEFSADRSLVSKIASLEAELAALKQQLADVAVSNHEDVPPPQPQPDLLPPRPQLGPAPTPAFARPVVAEVLPHVVDPYHYRTRTYYVPRECDPYPYSYGYNGLSFSLGGLNFGFYPSGGWYRGGGNYYPHYHHGHRHHHHRHDDDDDD